MNEDRQAAVQEYVGQPPAYAFSGVELRKMKSPCVYVLMRDKTVLYIGKSKNGLVRPFSAQHQALNLYCLQDADCLFVYRFADEIDATKMEQKLIGIFRPELNTGGVSRYSKEDNGELRTVNGLRSSKMPPWLDDPDPRAWVSLSKAATLFFRKTPGRLRQMAKDGTLDAAGVKHWSDGRRWWIRLDLPNELPLPPR
jgi:hypothetical protein